MKNNQYGFTLIELMIVIAIAAILVTFSVSSYRQYLQRVAFVDVTLAAQSIRKAVDECIVGDGFNVLAPCNDNPTTGSKKVIRAIAGAESLDRVDSARQWISSGHYYIEVISDGDAGNGFTYILKSKWNSEEELDWQVDSSSTCLNENLC